MMFKQLRVIFESKKIGPNPDRILIAQLVGDASLPVTIKALNSLLENPELRLYRTLISIQVLSDFDINLLTWKNPDKLVQVNLAADHESDQGKITAWYGEDPANEFFYLELADNPYNGIDLNLLIENIPTSKKDRIPDGIIIDLKLVVDEACTNIIEHGYKDMDPSSTILSLSY